MIKAVVFDCFGVMIMPGRTLLYQAFPELGHEISHLEHISDAGDITHEQFTKSISELTGIDEKTINEKYYDVRGYHEAIIDWARELKQTGQYKIGMLSNIGHNWINDFVNDMSKYDLFDEVVLSCDVDMMKPDPAIFKLMAKKLNLPTSECVMIDDIPANIDGAKAAGMNGIIFNTTIQTKKDFYDLVGDINARAA